jgi:hypothetical protein
MKNVTFYLGPALAPLATRTLVITRMPDAANDAYAAAHNADAGVVDTVTVALASNLIFQAVLTDVLDGGETLNADVLNFHTGDLANPGPRSGDRLQVAFMEDLSSSSSSSSSNSSSSQSSSSSSSQSSSSSSQSSSSSSSQSSSSSSSQSSSSSST